MLLRAIMEKMTETPVIDGPLLRIFVRGADISLQEGWSAHLKLSRSRRC
jgi:hypothetical protein